MDDNKVELNDSKGAENSRKRKNPFNLKRQKEERERRQKKRARVIVRNISFKVSEEKLREHLAQWGTIEELNVLKREDGKLKGCAFVQYETINQASKAILNGNGQKLIGRPLALDWALGKSQYSAKVEQSDEPDEKKLKEEIKDEADIKDEEAETVDVADETVQSVDYASEAEDAEDDEDAELEQYDGEDYNNDDDDDDEDKKDIKDVVTIKPEKHISNDVRDGCTVFIKNIPFDVDENQLRKVCRRFGLLTYAIINREKISGHSKGTAFVKFRTKDSADLCLQSGSELQIDGEVLSTYPALSRDELNKQRVGKDMDGTGKDSRNLYLAREGLIMAGSKAAEGLSAADMAQRHELERIKSHFLKNLNRFVSRNRLSIHNLPQRYDNDLLRQMVVEHTGLRPHECRVMREKNITADHPLGQSKGFGFMSFSTHQDALVALRKLNNNPKIFTAQRRPIVAFSIEDRSVHKLKESRNQRSKLNNPTYKAKLEQSKNKKNKKQKLPPLKDQELEDKQKIQKQIVRLEATRAAKPAVKPSKPRADAVAAEYMGEPAQPGKTLRMRSNKKIAEQASTHLKRLKDQKRKQKHEKIKQTHQTEKRANSQPGQKTGKSERDDLQPLIEKYKKLIGEPQAAKSKKPKRAKWYATTE